MLKSFIRLKLPAVLGVDVSGIVEKTGKNVKQYKAGDRVYAFLGINRNGAYAQYTTVPEAFAAHVPKNLDITEAGVVPGVGMTAYEAFTEYVPLKKGMLLMINGATGGVGTFAIQIAKHFGAEVTAVCSTERTGLAKTLGAHWTIDSKKDY